MQYLLLISFFNLIYQYAWPFSSSYTIYSAFNKLEKNKKISLNLYYEKVKGHFFKIYLYQGFI